LEVTLEPGTNHPWLRWAVFVIPAFATALSWRLTAALPFVNRVAIAVAVALVIFGAVYLLAKGLPR
jgi:hypothetical protein